jgi:hypothetical protein
MTTPSARPTYRKFDVPAYVRYSLAQKLIEISPKGLQRVF